MEQLKKYFDTAFGAPDGVKKLRELILTLAFEGRLVKQENTDLSQNHSKLELKRNSQAILIKENEKYSKRSDESINNLPSTWKIVDLSSVVEVLDNLRRPVTKGDRRPGPYPYYGASGIVDYVSHYIFDEPLVLVGEDGAKWGRGENTAFKISGKTWVNNHAHVLRPNREIITDEFLIYFLVSADLQPYITGMTVPKLNQARLNSIPIPIPPISEQKKIVIKINQLMSRCDELEKLRAERDQKQIAVHTAAIRKLIDASDHATFDDAWQFITRHFGDLYTIRENVAELRKAILQLAVMGKLVPQDPKEGTTRIQPNLLNQKAQIISRGQKASKQLPHEETVQNEIINPLPNNWRFVKLEDAIISIDAGWSPACETTPAKQGEWGVLKTTAVQSLAFWPKENKALPKKLKARPDIATEEGDILITRAGPKNRVGICCVARSVPTRLMLSDKIIRIKINQDLLDPDYCALSLTIGIGAEQIELSKSGMAESQMNISQDKIKKITIALPPLREQKRIVNKIQHLTRLSEIFEGHIEKVQEMKGKILGAVMADT